ncbi:natural killer tumor recognition sequence, isoform CRA_b, partial [Mus musculus]
AFSGAVRPARRRPAAALAMGAQDRPQCHFDIEINREPVGRIMFQLFSDICPKTCKNFLCLCSGNGKGGESIYGGYFKENVVFCKMKR